jgi:hypothetical protein
LEAGPRLEVDCQLQFSEFYHALRWDAWRRFWWLYCTLIIGAFGFGMVHVFHSISVSSFNAFEAILYTVGFPALLGGVFYYSVYRFAQQQFRTGSGFREQRHYIFFEEGVETSTSVSSGRSAWTLLYKVFETRESFFFFGSMASFTILPKRTLETEDRVQLLRNLIRQNVGAKAKLLK